MFNGMKYEVGGLGYTVGMLIIYIFGINKIAQTFVMLTAYNAYALCTDTQWDVLSIVIDTDATIEISEGKYKLWKLYKKYCIYSIILFITSAIMLVCLKLSGNPFNVRITSTILIMECGLFPLYALKYTLGSVLVLYVNGFMIMITNIITYTARGLVTISVKSDFALSYGVVTSCFIGLAFNIILYVTHIKKIRAGLNNINT